MFPAPGTAPGTALWPEISSPLTLNWLGKCSELSFAPQVDGWGKMHSVPRAGGKQVQLLAGVSSCQR